MQFMPHNPFGINTQSALLQPVRNHSLTLSLDSLYSLFHFTIHDPQPTTHGSHPTVQGRYPASSASATHSAGLCTRYSSTRTLTRTAVGIATIAPAMPPSSEPSSSAAKIASAGS